MPPVSTSCQMAPTFAATQQNRSNNAHIPTHQHSDPDQLIYLVLVLGLAEPHSAWPGQGSATSRSTWSYCIHQPGNVLMPERTYATAYDVPRLIAENAKLLAEVARLRAVEIAADNLIDDVRRRYPNEELRCRLMQALDKALNQ